MNPKTTKFFAVLLVLALIMMLALVACGDSNNHEGQAKTPSGSSAQKGRHFEDVISDFEKNGFTNIKTEVLDDLILGWLKKDGDVKSVSVDGNDNYSSDAWYPNDVEVMITYHTFPEKKRSQDNEESADTASAEESLELIFPVENAKRAAVVAITNTHASDVFATDGNTYDVTKAHSYSDTSGNLFHYYMNVNSWGTWSVKDEQTWHVDSLTLENSFGIVVIASLDVIFDGTNYIVSNITGTFGTFGTPMDLSDIEAWKENAVFLSISPELIKDDRSQADSGSHHSWVNNQFSGWDGSHMVLKDLIIKRLNDEKSFKHIETTYMVITEEEIKDRVNEMLKSSKNAARVEIGDLWITTQFSAKNSFNATIKNTAYGISSFSNNNVILVAIE